MIAANALAVLAYLLSCAIIIRRYPRYTIIFGFVSLLQGWALISCFYNDLGIYNFELFRYTEPGWATTRLALFYLLFNGGFWFMARLLRDRDLVRRDYHLADIRLRLGNLKIGAYLLIALVVVYLAYSLVSGGIPILSGLDRLSYLRESGPLDYFLVSYGILIAFALGLFRQPARWISVHALLLIAFLVYAVLVGHKFSFLLSVLVAYFTPIFARFVSSRSNFNPLRLRYMITAVLVALVFVGLAYATYVSRLDEFDGAGQLLVDRIFAGQGEVWWAVDTHVWQEGRYDPDHWEVELQRAVSPSSVSSDQVGMKYLMIKILGPERAYVLFDNGYLYTMAYPAILIASLPYSLAMLFQVLAGLFFCLLLYYLHYCVVYQHHIRALIACVVVFPFVATIFSGNLYVFLSIGMLVKLLVLLAAETGLLVDRPYVEPETT